MKAGWEVKPIKDVTFIQEGPGIRKYEYEEGGYPMINVRCVQDGYIDMSNSKAANPEIAEGKWKHFQIDEGDILFTISGTIGRTAIVRKTDLPLLMNTSVVRFRPTDPNLDRDYLYLFLQSDGFQKPLEELTSGAAIRNVGPTHIKTMNIPIPPLEEQKQIVAVLDAAFEGLTRAKENAEANLQNARELFESVQAELLTSGASDWLNEPIKDCFKLKSGDGLTAKAMVHGEFEVYGGNGVAGHHNRRNLSGLNVIIGRVGALCGNARLITKDIWLTDNAFLVITHNHDFDLTFLTFLLNFMKLRSYARQTAQPVISNSSLKDVVLSFPKQLSEQTEIADRLITLEAEVEELAETYNSKLANIAQLRQSLLQKAFAGELT